MPQCRTGRHPVSPVPECSGTGLRWLMLEYQQHRPWCRCPAMAVAPTYGKANNKGRMYNVHTNIPWVPQCLYWDSPPALPQACFFPGIKSPAGEGVGCPNSDDWRESLALCGRYKVCSCKQTSWFLSMDGVGRTYERVCGFPSISRNSSKLHVIGPFLPTNSCSEN
jgi:hypothetical protein